jgi:TM2 domain-containing membrane protein YozV
MIVDVFKNGDAVVISKAAAPADNNQVVPHQVNKIAYVLLCFFFGGIGIHKFYAGHWILGLLYLIFCWTFIPALIAFIEFIIGIIKPADNNGNYKA